MADVTKGRGKTRHRTGLWLALTLVATAALLVAFVRPGPALCPGLTAYLHPRAEAGAPPVNGVAFTCDTQTCRPVDAVLSTASGRFTTGEIDLTGDGVPEKVTFAETGVVIEEGGVHVWENPPEWTPVDADLGDPNQDGRAELLLAFWRNDAEGVAQNQPFIIGYRGGTYRTLWGGSPIAEPIRELALGDVDGDGEDDLVVLDVAAEEKLTVSVWRWHGWGFSLMWRSAPGSYRDLTLVPGANDGSSVIVAQREP